MREPCSVGVGIRKVSDPEPGGNFAMTRLAQAGRERIFAVDY